MKAVLDHVGIAVRDLDAALAFYRDALGLEVEASEEVSAQRVRAHFLPVGQSTLELLEATAADSPIARYLEKRGPGIHHITLRVDDIRAALTQLKTRGVRLLNEEPRPGAEGALVAFIHPASAHGVLVELKQSGQAGGPSRTHRPELPPSHEATADRQSLGDGGQLGRAGHLGQVAHTRHQLGALELVSLHDGFFRLDGGAMFGGIPKSEWEQKAQPDARNRVTLAMRPLVVRGVRTMLIDAGLGDTRDAEFRDLLGVDRVRNLDHTLAEAGLRPDDIDIVLATHLHFDHAGGFTRRDDGDRLRPAFPRARYVVRRGEWEAALQPHERSRSSYLPENLQALVDAGVLEMVDEDQTIMPGVRVRRTGGHTMHHQSVWIESQGAHAVYVGDLMPTANHLAASWMEAVDLYPVDTVTAKQALVKEAEEREALVLFPHDIATVAGYIRTAEDGEPRIEKL
jgi:methylmalonyl-CoA epimerase